MLATVGNYSFRSNSSFTVLKIKSHKLKIKTIDRLLFVEEFCKISKGITIKSGYILNKIVDCEIFKTNCFIAEKDGFKAHGKTVKKAISDLNFKIVAEKPKKEPIYLHTIMTDNYYRLITEACEIGVKNWKENNGITVDEITVKELLPILEKTNAYGLEKIKSLIVD